MIYSKVIGNLCYFVTYSKLKKEYRLWVTELTEECKNQNDTIARGKLLDTAKSDRAIVNKFYKATH